MGAKHLPMRMCCVCHKRAPKGKLMRLSFAFAGAYPMPDQKQNAPGRGIYVCNEDACQEAFSCRWQKRKRKG